MGKNTLRVAILNAILLTGGALVYPQTASAQGQAQSYRIEASDLESALSRFGTQSRIQLIYPPELMVGKRSNGLTGSHTPAEGLRRLLQGSGLEAERVNGSTVVIRQASAPTARPQAENDGVPPATQTPAPEVRELEQLTVTGTRIRGGATPSPTITIGSENIREAGFTDLGQVIRSLPQNFSGGQNPGVIPFTISGAGIQNQNVTGGSGLNLRGLGPDASLTLLNGRRMAYGGFSQAVDIGAIPVEAVDRIEIVADGASAIYGSDAVGGVGNVVLKRGMDGVSISAAQGNATEGGLSTREYSATAGISWASGGAIAAVRDLSVDAVFARQRRYSEHLAEPYTLHPDSDLRSGLLSAHQDVGDAVELRIDAFRTERSQDYAIVSAPTATRALPETTTSFVSPGIDIRLPNDWMLALGGTWAESEHVQLQSFSRIGESDPYSTSRLCYCNRSRAYELGAEGPLFELPAGTARLAAGAGYRANDYLQFDYVAGTDTTRGSDASRFAYAEISLPLLGQVPTLSGRDRLSMTAAVRSEDYDVFGRVSTPKAGLVYAPSADVTVKASWGRSFKAPTLHQRYYMYYSLLNAAPTWGGPDGSAVLVGGGGNQNLGPERARTWTASLAFHPVAMRNLDLEVSWFDIDYTDRVVEPLAVAWEALSNPIYDRFVVRGPSQEQQATFIGATDAFYNYTGEPYDPSNVVALIQAQYVNVARQRIRGFDLSGSYWREVAGGRLTYRGSVSWLDSAQHTVPHQPAFDLSGSLHNPPRLAGRLGAVYASGGLTASAFADYKGGVTHVAAGEKTASFTTFDAVLRYALAGGRDALRGLEFALTAQNLFNREPPLYTVTSVFSVPPYDATNYSPIGRFLNVSVSKHW